MHSEPGDQPSSPDVSLHVRTFNDWVIVLIEGEMDLQVVPLLAEQQYRDTGRVVFDLSGVTFMDAAGLGALVEAADRTSHAGGCMRVVIPPRVDALLVLTRCRGLFEIFDSLSEAVSAPVPT